MENNSKKENKEVKRLPLVGDQGGDSGVIKELEFKFVALHNWRGAEQELELHHLKKDLPPCRFLRRQWLAKHISGDHAVMRGELCIATSAYAPTSVCISPSASASPTAFGCTYTILLSVDISVLVVPKRIERRHKDRIPRPVLAILRPHVVL